MGGRARLGRSWIDKGIFVKIYISTKVLEQWLSKKSKFLNLFFIFRFYGKLSTKLHFTNW